jgi:hypothetical protein
MAAKTSARKKMPFLKAGNCFFMILIFDDQKCLLQTAINNLFGVIAFISSGECYLFDVWTFRGFLPDYLNFQCNGRE